MNFINFFLHKIIRIPVFRVALNDKFSKVAVFAYNFFSQIFNSKAKIKKFDYKKADISKERFEKLGACFSFVTPDDNQGKIQVMTLSWESINKKILELGGKWDLFKIGEEEVNAIKRPLNYQSNTDWQNFEKNISSFHWEEKDEYIITARIIPKSKVKETKCFLFVHDTSTSFISHWKRAGFYVGAKQNICFFDNGNTWLNSDRIVSERSFYLEVQKVLDHLEKNNQVFTGFENLWIVSTCGATAVASYLRNKLVAAGINQIIEHGISKISNFKAFGSSWNILKDSLNVSSQNSINISAYGFDVEKMWENITEKKGKTLFIEVKDDEHISSESYKSFFNLCEKVSQLSKKIIYKSDVSWHHSDNFFKYAEPTKDFWQFISN